MATQEVMGLMCNLTQEAIRTNTSTIITAAKAIAIRTQDSKAHNETNIALLLVTIKVMENRPATTIAKMTNFRVTLG